MGKPLKESRVELFGNSFDPEVKESLRKLAATGRKSKIIIRQSHDTGLGPCGKHYCSCKMVCLDHYAKAVAI